MSKQVNYGILKDYDGNEFIPIGHTELVYDENGNSVESRLTNIEAQAAFTKIKVNTTEIEADQPQDTLEIAEGDGITILSAPSQDQIIIGHSNSVTAGTAQGSESKTLEFEGTFTIPTITYDKQGHITSTGTTTMTMPSTDSLQEDLDKKFYDIETGSTPGSIKLISKDSSKEATVNGLGDSGDGKLYFVDNTEDKNVTAYVDGSGIHSQEFRIPGGAEDGSDILLSKTYEDVVSVQNQLDTTKWAEADAVGGSALNAKSAEKVANKLTIASKTFDGSSAVEITVADLGLAQAMKFLGVSNDDITQDLKDNTIRVNGESNYITAVPGNVVLYGKKEYVWTADGWTLLGDEGSYKIKQTPVADPTANGNAIAFIDTISQNDNGNITVTKKTIPVAGATLGLIKSGKDITIDASGLVSVNDDSHNHVIANIDGLGDILDNKFHDVSTGSTEGSIKLIRNSGNKEVTVNGLGHTGDGKFYFVDNTNNQNVTAYVDGAGVHSQEFLIPESNITDATVKSKVTGDLSLQGAYKSAITAQTTADTANNEANKANTAISNLKYAGSSSAGGAATSAEKFSSAKSIVLTGDVTGSANSDGTNGWSINTTVVNDSHDHKNGISGNAATATKFKDAQTITLTGDITGTASSTGGWTINTTVANSSSAGQADKWTTPVDFSIKDATNLNEGKKIQVDGSTDVVLNLPATIKADLNGNIICDDNAYYFTDKTSDQNVIATIDSQGIQSIDVFDKNKNALSTAVQTINATGTAPLTLSSQKNGNVVNITGSISTATQSAAGIMSADDKKKLDNTATTINNLKYAGAASAGGAATSAEKLTTSSKGSSTNPVYFENGIPVATANTLAKNISGNAATADKLSSPIQLSISNFDSSYGSTRMFVDGSENVTLKLPQMIKGGFILTDQHYGSTVPNGIEEGQLFFVDDESSGLPEGGLAGQILIKNSNADGDASWSNIPESNTTDKQYVVITGSDGMKFNSNIYTEHNVLFGAAWNDYAEYRAQKEIIEPGYCVASTDDGRVYKTIEKFQACDGIVSDTFGFAIGETNNCKTPLAVAGRVLAYFNGNREDYHAGDTVCAGPNGKVCKMTREEIREWPDRIIGIVSEIPQYETWGQNNILVNNRIWIKVK